MKGRKGEWGKGKGKGEEEREREAGRTDENKYGPVSKGK